MKYPILHLIGLIPTLFFFLFFSFFLYSSSLKSHKTPQNSMSQSREFNPHFFQHQQHQPQHQPQPQPQGAHSQQGAYSHQHPQDAYSHQQPQGAYSHPHGIMLPPQNRTQRIIWLAAVFCAILWVVIILGGLAILIIYLVFRPQSPRFDIQSASLNAAYLDMGTLLNADVTILANFTNPNKKVKVDIGYTVIDLYYGDTLIATSTIGSFSAISTESKLQNIHMVSSEVGIPTNDTRQLRNEIEGNSVTMYVKGLFRTRSRFGNLFRYSYWLHSHCDVVMTGPPSGVLVSSKCRTKR